MTRSFFYHAALAVCALTLSIWIAPPSRAQDNASATQRIRGEIIRIAGDLLYLRASNGQPTTVLLAPDATVTSVKPAKLTDIQRGRSVGAAARPEAGGRWQAIEVHIFPVGARVSDGHHPWAPEPGATMTNAEVTAAEVKASAGKMTLTTGGQTYEFDVPKGTPIVTMDPGTRALLKKGAHVAIGQAQPGAGGSYITKAIIVTDAPNWPPK
ncbi:MAG TPA: hypothetical protein VG328_19090 [Stellaceae bacterium]|jgi:hypothetical protein|nr:hypothetical protein [Stellaceae bacterium]